VLTAAGAPTPGKLVGAFAGRAPNVRRALPATSVYYKYLRGEAGPSPRQINELETAFPGTLAWYDHPIWSLARRPLNVFELGELLTQLPARVRDGWVVHSFVPGQLFWRDQAMSLPSKAAQMLEGNDLDQAAGALGLIQDALSRQDEADYLCGWVVWALVGARMRGHPVCGVLYPHFFGALASTLQAVVFESAPVRRQLRNILEAARRQFSWDDDNDESELREPLVTKSIATISAFDVAVLQELTKTEFARSLTSASRLRTEPSDNPAQNQRS
jgi:hypothetical protein